MFVSSNPSFSCLFFLYIFWAVRDEWVTWLRHVGLYSIHVRDFFTPRYICCPFLWTWLIYCVWVFPRVLKLIFRMPHWVGRRWVLVIEGDLPLGWSYTQKLCCPVSMSIVVWCIKVTGSCNIVCCVRCLREVFTMFARCLKEAFLPWCGLSAPFFVFFLEVSVITKWFFRCLKSLLQ